MRSCMYLLTSCVALLAPGLAHAYIGPGAGLSAIGSFLALLGALLMLVVGFLWYPVKRMLKRNRQETQGGAGGSDPEP